MPKLQKFFYIIGFVIILSGCIQKNKEFPTQKQKNCNQHIKIMQYALSYVEKEFDNGYFHQNDLIGAKAQLFLIENRSPNIFAQNINEAQKSYDIEYDLAKKANCDIDKFTVSPIQNVKNKIKTLSEGQK
jgi:hypothetical protein